MSTTVTVNRKTLSLTFSKKLEALLLNADSSHHSLTHDIEAAAYKGLSLLRDLEDVRDIKNTTTIRGLISKSNDYATNKDEYFKYWYIDISEDLLDEIDLIMLTHSEDLRYLGMSEVNINSVLILLVVAALM